MKKQIDVICGLIVDGDKLYCEYDTSENIFELWSFINCPVFDYDKRIELLNQKVKSKLNAEIVEFEEFASVPFTKLSIDIITHAYVCKISNDYKITDSTHCRFLTIDEIIKLNLSPIHREILLEYIAKYSKF